MCESTAIVTMAAAVWGWASLWADGFHRGKHDERFEKSLFAGVSIGFCCPRTGVGMVLFSGTQSINELPLLCAITCEELEPKLYDEAREKAASLDGCHYGYRSHC